MVIGLLPSMAWILVAGQNGVRAQVPLGAVAVMAALLDWRTRLLLLLLLAAGTLRGLKHTGLCESDGVLLRQEYASTGRAAPRKAPRRCA